MLRFDALEQLSKPPLGAGRGRIHRRPVRSHGLGYLCTRQTDDMAEDEQAALSLRLGQKRCLQCRVWVVDLVAVPRVRDLIGDDLRPPLPSADLVEARVANTAIEPGTQRSAVAAQVRSGGADVEAGVQHGVGITGQQLRWPNGLMPYTIDASLTNQQRVTDAMATVRMLRSRMIRAIVISSSTMVKPPGRFFRGRRRC